VEEPAKQGSPSHALILTHLGALYTRYGRHGQAEQYFQRALEINHRLLTPDHPRLLESISGYAALLRATKRKREAKKLEAYVDEHRRKHQAENPTLVNIVDIHALMKQSGR
jgi:tetratricopeptide (TPR) repeat protein